MFAVMDEIFLPRPVARYIARLVAATHAGSAEAAKVVNDYVSFGASPRAAIAMAEAARAQALLDGRPSVGFDDVKFVAPAVLNHRLILNYKARFDKVDTYQVIRELLKTVDETGINLPADVVIDKEVARV
jgi:MoxR-like ATPase